jgi:hypothetical protein
VAADGCRRHVRTVGREDELPGTAPVDRNGRLHKELGALVCPPRSGYNVDSKSVTGLHVNGSWPGSRSVNVKAQFPSL